MASNGGSIEEKKAQNDPSNQDAADTSTGKSQELTPLNSPKDESHGFPGGIKAIVLFFCIKSFVITVALIIYIYEGKGQLDPLGGVVTRTEQCTEVGADMLRHDGTAVDAAIAAFVCLTVMKPHAASLGGGGLLLVHEHKTQTSELWDLTEVATAKAEQSDLAAPADSPGLLVGVPGLLTGLHAMHKKYGRMGWQALFYPAVDIARNGFRVDPELEEAVASLPEKSPVLNKLKGASGGNLAVGDIVRLPDLSNTLLSIGRDGAASYLASEGRSDIASTVQKHGGKVTEADLAAYKPLLEEQSKSQATYFEQTVEAGGSAGQALIMLLNIAQELDLNPDHVSEEWQVYHRLVQAYRYSVANLTHLGDRTQKEVEQLEEKMRDKDVAKAVADTIKSIKNVSAVDLGAGMVPLPEAVLAASAHAEVLAYDKDGLSVSGVFSLGSSFGGAGLVTEGGILLNNAIARFSDSAEEDSNNKVSPGHRALHAGLPLIIYRKGHLCSPRILMSSVGLPHLPASGDTVLDSILSAAQVAVQIINFGKSPAEAVSQPRLSVDAFTGRVSAEKRFDGTVLNTLQNTMGYTIDKTDLDKVAVVEVLNRFNNTLLGAADTRAGPAKGFKLI